MGPLAECDRLPKMRQHYVAVDEQRIFDDVMSRI